MHVSASMNKFISSITNKLNTSQACRHLVGLRDIITTLQQTGHMIMIMIRPGYDSPKHLPRWYDNQTSSISSRWAVTFSCYNFVNWLGIHWIRIVLDWAPFTLDIELSRVVIWDSEYSTHLRRRMCALSYSVRIQLTSVHCMRLPAVGGLKASGFWNHMYVDGFSLGFLLISVLDPYFTW